MSVVGTANRQVDVAVVGAGPAGMAAAATAAGFGLRTAIIDEAPRPGGQIFRQPPAAWGARVPAAARGLFRRFAAAPVDHRFDAVVFDLPDDHTLALFHEGSVSLLTARAIIFATGAIERVVPFPGWTLPGVVTAGALQRMVKTQDLLLGERVVIAGTGPLLPVVALEAARAGARVVAVLEAAPARHRLRLVGTIKLPSLALDAARIGAALARRRIPYLWGWTVVAARGGDRLVGLDVRRLGADGRPFGPARLLTADALGVHHGFVPAIQLPSLAGCRIAYEARLGGWVPEHDPVGRTSRERHYVAGDGAGVSGAWAGRLQGQLAALAAAHDLGAIDTATFAPEAASRLRRLQRFHAFRDLLARTFPPFDLYQAIPAETTVCRCEDVTRAELDAALAAGARGGNQLKAWTRAGMGPCQGRICGHAIEALSAVDCREPGERLTVRPPIVPIPISALMTQDGSAASTSGSSALSPGGTS